MAKLKVTIEDKTFYRKEAELMEIFRLFRPHDNKGTSPLKLWIKAYLLRKEGNTLKVCGKSIEISTDYMRIVEAKLDYWLYRFETNNLWRVRRPDLFHV